MGTPLRTLRMEPDFHTSDTYLAHPDVCQPFVECITGIEWVDQPERLLHVNEQCADPVGGALCIIDDSPTGSAVGLSSLTEIWY